jgi:hypothetical protein
MLAGYANIFTHVGDGFSAALMIGGTANIFTKVGNGITLAAMVGSANIFTHIGNGFSVAFAIGQANIVTADNTSPLGKRRCLSKTGSETTESSGEMVTV